jgi:hypothetical protein
MLDRRFRTAYAISGLYGSVERWTALIRWSSDSCTVVVDYALIRLVQEQSAETTLPKQQLTTRDCKHASKAFPTCAGPIGRFSELSLTAGAVVMQVGRDAHLDTLSAIRFGTTRDTLGYFGSLIKRLMAGARRTARAG